jgi:hypothetical protein
MSSGHHEDFNRQAARRGPSDRSFGLVLGGACAFLGLWPAVRGGAIRPPWLAVSAVLLGLCLVRPALLRPANRLWTGLGVLLGRIVNPVVTGLLFYLVFTPAGLIARWAGKDLLSVSRDARAETYWIDRPPSSAPAGMNDPF